MKHSWTLILLALALSARPSFAQIGPVQWIDSTTLTAGLTQFEMIDLDLDGQEEILVSISGVNGKVGFFPPVANGLFGEFQPIGDIPIASGVASGYFNQDEWPDLVAIGGLTHSAWIYLQDSSGFPSPILLDDQISILVNDVVVADFDSTQGDDLVIIGQHSIDFYRNDGSGNFTKEPILTTSTSPKVLECIDVAKADMDGDGDMDLITGETAGLVVYLNDGWGQFSPDYFSLIEEVVEWVQPVDLDQDLDIDVIIKGNSGDIKWFSNDGTGALTYEATWSHLPNLTSVATADFDLDGDMDLLASHPNAISMFLNDSLQSFQSEIPLYQNPALIMGQVQVIDLPATSGMDIVWSGANSSVGYHLNLFSPSTSTELIRNSLSAFPNPTEGIILCDLCADMESIEVYASDGRVVHTTLGDSKIDLSHLQDGVYLIRGLSHEGIATSFFKVIKQ
ncbi:T9SS type A sorting domain-containing protein [Pontibacter sp. G13]|uniref:T9SS type A sorting domain-containing protein n=1 Tax=Pontibacter sp. G13 TaxID=3074898 RepID=UPI00288BB6FF|nr:T9SS type A sorting domain-containing protein [Pontibacter sp. G13]WNJ19357.1 T9SS type A sorting domain-containing protein [Pontibacter sp. G13]